VSGGSEEEGWVSWAWKWFTSRFSVTFFGRGGTFLYALGCITGTMCSCLCSTVGRMLPYWFLYSESILIIDMQVHFMFSPVAFYKVEYGTVGSANFLVVLVP